MKATYGYYLNNWRPISLLNVPYKIASSCIAKRIKAVLPNIISINQSGFLKGRYIGDSIRTVYDIIHSLEEDHAPGILFGIDFEKAFDSISIRFIRNVLKLFNFGPSIIHWFDTFYGKNYSSVVVNGYLSEKFPIERGCRQGDPLSPYLFILSVELLSILVNDDDSIRGIDIGGSCFKIVQYADDTTFFLHGDEVSLNNVIRQVDYFGSLSGLKLNLGKSILVGLGSMVGSSIPINQKYKIVWNTGEDFTLLGIVFNTDLGSMVKKNYDNALNKMSNISKLWVKRNLTVLGRITIVKSLLLPYFNYYIMTLPLPTQEYIDRVNSLFFRFVWKNKPDRVSRRQLVQGYAEGGLKMVDFSKHCSALKVSTFGRLLKSEGSSFISCYLRRYKICTNFFFKNGDFYVKLVSSKVSNPFWKNLFETSYMFLRDEAFTINNDTTILTLPIWNSSLIKIENSPVYYKRWYDKGICFIGDLVNSNGTFYTFDTFIQKFQVVTNFLEYYGIIDSIKSFWKGISKYNKLNIACPLNCYLNSQLANDALCSKAIYNRLLSFSSHEHKSYIKWCQTISISKEDWSFFCSVPFQCSSDTKLRWFQYRLLHRIIPTNRYLHLLKITTFDKCDFCHEYIETIDHLFYFCTHAAKIWNKLQMLLNKAGMQIVIMDISTVLFGANFARELNLIIILVKQFIFDCKLRKKIPRQENLLMFLRDYFVLQKNILLRNMKISEWEKFWLPWYHFLQLHHVM